ncbi:MAG: alkaline shock response membrane anchor protein AmaP [Candidatus Omnitrophica bacterium]|nr:alkaline shock response membrane anchor protein AmaP [Candidatus Omnitrophota bacterium]
MRIWNRIVASIYVLTGLFFTLSVLFLWVNEKWLELYQSFLTRYLFRIGLASLIVLMLGITWLVNWLDTLYHNRAITFDNPGGKVKVSLKAIEEFVSSRILNQIPGVKSLKIRAGLSPRGLETGIRLKLMAGANIPETCAHIQEVTKNYLQDVVGVERVSTIEVFVSSIIVKEVEKAEGSSQEEAEPENEQ